MAALDNIIGRVNEVTGCRPELHVVVRYTITIPYSINSGHGSSHYYIGEIQFRLIDKTV